MKVPDKRRRPSPIIFQKFTVHGHVLEDYRSRGGRVNESGPSQ